MKIRACALAPVTSVLRPRAEVGRILFPLDWDGPRAARAHLDTSVLLDITMRGVRRNEHEPSIEVAESARAVWVFRQIEVADGPPGVGHLAIRRLLKEQHVPGQIVRSRWALERGLSGATGNKEKTKARCHEPMRERADVHVGGRVLRGARLWKNPEDSASLSTFCSIISAWNSWGIPARAWSGWRPSGGHSSVRGLHGNCRVLGELPRAPAPEDCFSPTKARP